MALSEYLLQILACPKCHGKLTLAEDHLVCAACALKFPIRDGIPVLLVDQAKPC